MINQWSMTNFKFCNCSHKSKVWNRISIPISDSLVWFTMFTFCIIFYACVCSIETKLDNKRWLFKKTMREMTIWTLVFQMSVIKVWTTLRHYYFIKLFHNKLIIYKKFTIFQWFWSIFNPPHLLLMKLFVPFSKYSVSSNLVICIRIFII